MLRFAFDIGTNSLGWAVLEGLPRHGQEERDFELIGDLTDVRGCGVRIFSDGRNPKDGQSLAVMRRGPRAARRRRDRFLQRQRGLMRLLVLYGLYPEGKAEQRALERIDPLAIRKRALTEAVSVHEFGRALWHLNKRRGFQSNRKTDGADKESGVVKDAQKKLRDALEESGARTLGDWLADRSGKEGARFRPSDDPKVRFDFYPSRDMVEDEFKALWEVQSGFHPGTLNETARTAISKIIFHQRKLKPTKVGKCTFHPEESRVPKILPSVEAREIYERLNQLRYGVGLVRDTRLTREQRDWLADQLLSGKSVSWDGLRRQMKLGAEVKFNLEDHLARGLPNSEIAKTLSAKDAFGPVWFKLPWEAQDLIVTKLIETEDEADLAAWLVKECGVSPEKADTLAQRTLKDKGYSRLGATANRKILHELIADHEAVYSEAVRRAGYDHSQPDPEHRLSRLPYYGEVLERHIIEADPDLKAAAQAFIADRRRNKGSAKAKPHARKFEGAGLGEALFGRVTNPTVHIALNQLRLVVNRLIDVYGPPDEIVIELARELKLPREEVEKRNKENRQNFEKNQKRRDQLKELNIEDTGEAMARLRLWEDQHVDGVACCPYSLRPISIEALNGGQIDIDHILPFSRTLDDSPANKVVCFAEANRRKGNRTPHEAFSEEPDWERIVANAEKLPRNKRWRFAPDAMERFNRTERNFLDRQLVETQYLSRLARSYLQTLTPNVWVVTGQLTALLRGKWGLNRILDTNARKNRDDHRHHAVDAITIGCTSRSLLQRVATQAERAEQNLERLFADFPEPIPGFFEKARSRVLAVVVSHKPEHGKGGGLHEDTAYGLNVREDEKDLGDVVYRKAIDQMTVGDAKRIRDPDIRRQIAPLVAEVEGLPKGEQDKAIRSKLRAWAMEQARAFAEANPGQHRNPVRRLRILKPEAAIIPITDRRTGAPYKGLVPAENWCMDIVRMRDGSWKGFAANIFEVNRKGWRPVWEREKLGGLLVMRLHKGDMVEVDEPDGRRAIKRVVRLEPSAGRIRLVEHFEGGDLEKRHVSENDAFRWDLASISRLRDRRAIKLRIVV